MTFSLTLDLYGMFFFALEKDANTSAIAKVWILGVDARSGCLASDKLTYMASHWPALQINPANITPNDIVEQNMVVLDPTRALWLFDGHQLGFDLSLGKAKKLSGYFQGRQATPTDGNRDYFSWIADLPSVVPGAQLKPELFGTDPPGVSCRMGLEVGAFTTAELGSVDGKYLDFSFEQLSATTHHKRYGALANGISVALGDDFEMVTLKRTPIAGTGDPGRKEVSIYLRDDGSQAARITLFNTPSDQIVSQEPAVLNSGYVAHFEHFYDLLQNPPAQLLVPYSLGLKSPGPTNHNISCPPGSAVI